MVQQVRNEGEVDNRLFSKKKYFFFLFQLKEIEVNKDCHVPFDWSKVVIVKIVTKRIILPIIVHGTESLETILRGLSNCIMKKITHHNLLPISWLSYALEY